MCSSLKPAKWKERLFGMIALCIAVYFQCVYEFFGEYIKNLKERA